jgi:hypothetical protein
MGLVSLRLYRRSTYARLSMSSPDLMERASGGGSMGSPQRRSETDACLHFDGNVSVA